MMSRTRSNRQCCWLFLQAVRLCPAFHNGPPGAKQRLTCLLTTITCAATAPKYPSSSARHSMDCCQPVASVFAKGSSDQQRWRNLYRSVIWSGYSLPPNLHLASGISGSFVPGVEKEACMEPADGRIETRIG